MPIPEGVSTNFKTMLRAAKNGDLALMECLDAETKQLRYVITAIERRNGEVLMTPFGHLVSDRNPFEAYLPPDPNNPGGFIVPEFAE